MSQSQLNSSLVYMINKVLVDKEGLREEVGKIQEIIDTGLHSTAIKYINDLMD